MDQKTRILVLISLLVIGGVFLWFYKIRDLDSGNPLKASFLMRNLTWQTEFQETVPYKKWDELEYSAIFSSDTPESIGVSLKGIKQRLEIERIQYNDADISESDLAKLSIQESGILKVTGKAKTLSAQDSDTAKDGFLLRSIPPAELRKKIATPVEKNKANSGTSMTTPPSLLTLSATHFNTNIANLLTIQGKNTASIATVNIGGTSFTPVHADDTLYITLDRDAFATGEYFLFYQLTNGLVITPSTKISFEHSPEKINIANITPGEIQNDQDRFIVLQGNGFDKIVSIQLSNNLILKNAEFTPISKQVVGVKIPKWLAPGAYYFNIMDTESIYELKNMKFTIY